ncbi:VOC family protein [Bordetella genomosp. 13]|uniref:VOC family protein n=1 Tax=Bordetella genomosp. 13 TaxID=463040 RepID=UPI00119D010A|nr:VOC family protein [Bordetella genomosp. 13]
MFSHVTVGTTDLQRSERFYDAILFPLGLVRRAGKPDGKQGFACWVDPDKALPRFYVYEPFDGEPGTAGNGSMVAFLASSQALVDQAYQAGMQAGGSDEGAPGERPHYAPGYYGAYLRDPDGNKVHIVFRGDMG